MDYKSPAEASQLGGLRIALTAGVPAPWSMAARYMFDVKGIEYIPVLQVASEANEELVAWTGHRNAPVVVLDDEPPRTNWADIIELAERLNPEPPLVPADPEQRIRMFGLCNEICGAGGYMWNARHLMMAPLMNSSDPGLSSMRQTMGKAYGYSEQAAAAAPALVAQVLTLLAGELEAQQTRGSRYYLGDSLTALDLVWASFSNTLRPLPEEVNPMDPGIRKVYSSMGEFAKPPDILFEHRDFIYRNHLTLPLDF
jgi:glutathione S-transferase